MEYPFVLDAAITQRNETLILVVIVGPAVNADYARELGDNFVRMVKALSPDDPPGRYVGTGIYDYRIGVYYPNETSAAVGAKVRSSPIITW